MKTRRTAIALALLTAYSAVQAAIDSTTIDRSPCELSPTPGMQPRWADYELAGANGAGIEQVCNDPRRTYLFFGESIPPQLRIAGPDGRELAYQRQRHEVVIDGLYTELSIEAGEEQTMLVLQPELLPPAPITAMTEAADPGRAGEVQDMTSAGDPSLMSEFLDASAIEGGELQRASHEQAAPAQEENASTGAPSVLTRVGFGFDSAALVLSDEDKQELLKLIAKAQRIELRGRTDSIGAAAYNQRLALKRAQAVRDFLVSQGIDPAAVTVSAAPNTDYIAANDSAAGRAQNRRVDIVAIGDDDTLGTVAADSDLVPAEEAERIALLD